MEDNVELDVLESNELIFNVHVEGASVAPHSRMVIENKEVSYSFEGKSTNTPGNVSFLIPEGIIQEGLYPAKIEVIVGNKILIPMKFSTLFKRSINMNSDIVETNSYDNVVEASVKMLPIKSLKNNSRKGFSQIKQEPVIPIETVQHPTIQEMTNTDVFKEAVKEAVQALRESNKQEQQILESSDSQVQNSQPTIKMQPKPKSFSKKEEISLKERWLAKKK